MPKYSNETIDQARQMYLAGISPQIIEAELQLNSRRIIYTWVEKYKWREQLTAPDAQLITTMRYNLLIDKEEKTKADYHEIHQLTDCLVKLEKSRAHRLGANVGTGRPVGVKNGQGKPKKVKNDISALTAADFEKFEKEVLFHMQREYISEGENSDTYRTRFYLKSRKIGWSWIAAYEAFKTGVLKGHNQVFVSATRAQAEVFKAYIFLIAKEYFNVELKGNPTVLSNGATFHYLSTSILSAQTVGGDVYFDEVFWTRNFLQLWDVANPIASFKQYKRTLISTPSSISHSAYQLWSGKEYNKGRKKADQVSIPLSHSKLKNGLLCGDGVYRKMITVEDAVAKGYDLVDIDQLKKERSPEKFRIFYMCQFINDTNSIFNLNDLLACAVDNYAIPAYKPDNARPLGNRQVTIGYDPSGERDNATASIQLVPTDHLKPFWLIDKQNLVGGANNHAATLQSWCNSFNVAHLEVDQTGTGMFIPDFIEPFYPNLTRATYTPAYKSAMVNKALQIVRSGRFKYPAEMKEIALSFMTIEQFVTESTNQISYRSRRSADDEVGHGDAAWSLMHGWMVEGNNPEQRTTSVVI